MRRRKSGSFLSFTEVISIRYFLPGSITEDWAKLVYVRVKLGDFERTNSRDRLDTEGL